MNNMTVDIKKEWDGNFQVDAFTRHINLDRDSLRRWLRYGARQPDVSEVVIWNSRTGEVAAQWTIKYGYEYFNI